MATLAGRTISSAYGDLLQVYNDGQGADGTLRAVEDGRGTATALKLSTAAIAGPIYPTVLFVPSMAFYAVTGSPSAGTLGYSGRAGATWRLDDTTDESVGVYLPAPVAEDKTSLTVDVYWAMESATSGDVRLIGYLDSIADGEACDASAASATATATVPATAKTLEITSLVLNRDIAAADVLRLTIHRDADNAADTATGDLHFLGVRVIFS